MTNYHRRRNPTAEKRNPELSSSARSQDITGTDRNSGQMLLEKYSKKRPPVHLILQGNITLESPLRNTRRKKNGETGKIILNDEV